MYGIFDNKFLNGLKNSEKLHIYEKLKDMHIKYNKLKNII
jgi:hypothetical protein